MIKARASGSKVYLYFMKKGRQARHRIQRNSCCGISTFLLPFFLKKKSQGALTGVGELNGANTVTNLCVLASVKTCLCLAHN